MPFPPDSFEQIASLIREALGQIWIFLLYLDIPIPIGIIGAWRWGIWGVRRLIGRWYRAQEPNGYWMSTAVVTPVYNEDPELFRAALRSWAANQPKEIIAVIDHTDTRCMAQFREFEEEIAHAPIELKMMITKTPGKRPALADGILVATSDVVFLVDSDTVWDPDVLPKALAPFIDPEVGGVTIRQRVLGPNSTAQRIFDVYLDIRYIDEIRFLTAFGDAVTCLSGRTAVYRRAVALTALEDLMEETFWGRRVISGDDKALTLAVQSRGWKVCYQGNTCVYTPGATVMKEFLKQRLRWARNSWRADLKALGSRWAWRKPFLAFHLFDRLFQPLTTLIAPIYLSYALYHQNWPAVLILIGWWTISRTIKIWPHLRRDWKNIRVLPWYITFNYWSAVTKIYAFFTMNRQGWITRWSRGGKANAWLQWIQAMPSYAATATTVALVAIFVNYLHQVSAQIRLTPIVSQMISLDETSTENIRQSEDAQAEDEILLARSTFEQKGDPVNVAIAMAQDVKLCVLAGQESGACTTYAISRHVIPQRDGFFFPGRTFWRDSMRRLRTILPQAVIGQEARWPVSIRPAATPLSTTSPAVRQPFTNQLCLIQNGEEANCIPYTVK